MPEIAVAAPPRARGRRGGRRARARGRSARRRRAVAVTRGPGLIGALLVGLSAAKALAAARGLPLVAGRPPARARGGQHARRRSPIEPPSSAWWRAAATRSLARVDDPPRYSVLGRTLDDAAGEAFDKGARLLGLGYPGGPEIDRLARDGRSRGVRLPARRAGRARLQLQRAQDRAALPRARPGRGGAERRRADLAASYQRAIVDALVARARQALEREGARSGWPSAAAWRPTRSCAPRWLGCGRDRVGPADRALHRQRCDDRRRRPLPEPLPYPAYLALDAGARGGLGVGASHVGHLVELGGWCAAADPSVGSPAVVEVEEGAERGGALVAGAVDRRRPSPRGGCG